MTITRKRKSLIDLEKAPIELDTKRAEQPFNAYLPKLPAAVHKEIIAGYLNPDNDPKTLAGLSRSCFQLYSIYQSDLNKQRLQQFLQAVVDDKIEIVKHILKAYPGLLLEQPKKKMVIESQYTWQKFDVTNENALTIAAKRRQLEMLETLLDYLNKLQDQELAMTTKAAVLLKWPSYEHKEEKSKLDIPQEYIAELERMMKVFKNETFPNGRDIRAKCSEATEEALCQFREKNLPKGSVTLDETIQGELFLYAACKIYDDHFYDEMQDYYKRSAYCRYIIGFLQSLLTPKVAEKVCQGLHYVVKKNRAINFRASELKVCGGSSFYRESRDSLAGLGFDHFLSLCDGLLAKSGWESFVLEGAERLIWKTISNKNSCIASCQQRPLNTHTQ